MSKILILNGPNLNLLGEREPEIYGYESLDDISSSLDSVASEIQVNLSHQQFNSEAELIDEIHRAKSEKMDFIIFNPGAFTHTSVSIRDAISIFSQNNKIVEVHISDINKREDFRKINLIKEFSKHSIIGQGVDGYLKALEYIDGE